MQFSSVRNFSSKIKKIDLPGEEAQILLAPDFRKKSLKQSYDVKTARRAGVLMLFYPNHKDEAHFVLILRKSYKGVHSNQVALPGGKYEKEDGNLVQTALRETEEEIGIQASTIEVIRPLTELYIPPSNFLVKPTLGMIDYEPHFVKQDSEVERVIPVKLKDFMESSNIKPGMIKTSYAGETQVMSYHINGFTVWGATAMMLSELQVIMKRIQSV